MYSSKRDQQSYNYIATSDGDKDRIAIGMKYITICIWYMPYMYGHTICVWYVRYIYSMKYVYVWYRIANYIACQLIIVAFILQEWSGVMELLQTQLTDRKQKIDQLESELSVSKQNLEPQVVKLQEENKTFEAQLVSVQVGVVDDS